MINTADLRLKVQELYVKAVFMKTAFKENGFRNASPNRPKNSYCMLNYIFPFNRSFYLLMLGNFTCDTTAGGLHWMLL